MNKNLNLEIDTAYAKILVKQGRVLRLYSSEKRTHYDTLTSFMAAHTHKKPHLAKILGKSAEFDTLKAHLLSEIKKAKMPGLVWLLLNTGMDMHSINRIIREKLGLSRNVSRMVIGERTINYDIRKFVITNKKEIRTALYRRVTQCRSVADLVGFTPAPAGGSPFAIKFARKYANVRIKKIRNAPIREQDGLEIQEGIT